MKMIVAHAHGALPIRCRSGVWLLAVLTAVLAGCGSQSSGIRAPQPTNDSLPRIAKSSLRHQPQQSRKAGEDVPVEVALTCATNVASCGISKGVVHIVAPAAADVPLSATGAVGRAVLSGAATAAGSVSWLSVLFRG